MKKYFLFFFLISNLLFCDKISFTIKESQSKQGIEKAKFLSELIQERLYKTSDPSFKTSVYDALNSIEKTNEVLSKFRLNIISLYFCLIENDSNKYAIQLYNAEKMSQIISPTEVIKGYLFLSRLHRDFGVLDSSLKYAQLSFDLSNKNNLPEEKVKSMILLAEKYTMKGDQNKAIDLYNQCLNQSKDKYPFLEFASYSDLGLLMISIKKSKEALDYLERAKIIFENKLKQIDNANAEELLFMRFMVNNNLCGALNQLNRSKESYPYLIEATTIAKQLENSRFIAQSLTNLGVYFDMQDQLDSALYYYKTALDISNQNNLTQGQIINLSNIAMIYNKRDNPKLAIEYNEKALNLSFKNKIKYLLPVIYKDLSVAYEKLGNFKKALEFSKLYQSENDSLVTAETDAKLNSIHMKAEVERQLNLAKIQTDQDAFKLKVIIISILIIFSIIAFGLYLRYKEKHKLSEELHLKNKEIENQNSKLLELNSTKDKFFSIIAHDLKGPLGNFKNMIDLILREFNHFSITEAKEYLSLLSDSAKNIFSLLNNLLDWSRSQQGIIKLNVSEFGSKEFIENTISLLKIVASEKQINLKDKTEDNFIINGDANLLTTVLRNLISNSIKFTPNNGEISVDIASKHDELILSVSDNGIGMDSDKVNSLFNINTNKTTLGTNEEKGTGLGLILCKDFVELHNGKIWVESEIGKGSTFFFSVPI